MGTVPAQGSWGTHGGKHIPVSPPPPLHHTQLGVIHQGCPQKEETGRLGRSRPLFASGKERHPFLKGDARHCPSLPFPPRAGAGPAKVTVIYQLGDMGRNGVGGKVNIVIR